LRPGPVRGIASNLQNNYDRQPQGSPPGIIVIAAYIIGLAFMIVLVFLIVKFANSDRFADMTDQEFEAESKRASSIAGPIAVFQKLIDPGHHVEYVQEEKQGKPQSAQPGDGPESGRT
jgi:hypothetical protein